MDKKPKISAGERPAAAHLLRLNYVKIIYIFTYNPSIKLC